MSYVKICSGSLLINVKLFSLIRGKDHSVNHETVWVVRKFAEWVCVD
jgi:hypothetical protein